MNEKYGFKNKGITKYLVNRALRIYPTYLICMGLTAALVYAFPWLTWQLSRSVTMPGSLHLWFSNIFIIGLDGFSRGRFVPQAWSLYVEIIFYLLIGLVLARKKALVVAWLIFGIISTMYLSGGEVRDTVFSITAGSLPFSLGATVYYFKDEFGTARPAFLIIAVVLYLLNISNLAGSVHESGMYLSLYLSFLLLIVLKDLKRPSPKRSTTFWVISLIPCMYLISSPGFLCSGPFSRTYHDTGGSISSSLPMGTPSSFHTCFTCPSKNASTR
jgi:peptidoglycan/LPS O-acetylase OafA/YrhL